MQDDLLLERSMMALLLGLFNKERLANEMSAVTRVMVILLKEREAEIGMERNSSDCRGSEMPGLTHLPSNLFLRNSKRAFCIMSVTS